MRLNGLVHASGATALHEIANQLSVDDVPEIEMEHERSHSSGDDDDQSGDSGDEGAPNGGGAGGALADSHAQPAPDLRRAAKRQRAAVARAESAADVAVAERAADGARPVSFTEGLRFVLEDVRRRRMEGAPPVVLVLDEAGRCPVQPSLCRTALSYHSAQDHHAHRPPTRRARHEHHPIPRP